MPAQIRLPHGLEPEPSEQGMASGDLEALCNNILTAWDLFVEVIASADLDRPSRKSGWTGREIVAKMGAWECGIQLSDLEADARLGRAGFYDGDEIDERVRKNATQHQPSAVVAAVVAARSETAQWLSSANQEEFGLTCTSSPLGPLPLLTVLHARAYQLALAALDLEVCGAEVPEQLIQIGLMALVDTTGALAARQRVEGSFAAITSDLIVASGSRAGNWKTAVLTEEPEFGPGVVAPARTILEITSGRTNLRYLYASGAIRVRDLGGLLRLAPALSGVPGIPPLGAVGRAMSLVDAVGGVVGRLRN